MEGNKMAIEIITHESVATGERYIGAKYSVNSIVSEHTGALLVREIAKAIAERYVSEHYAEIAAKLDQNAIANLAIAEASKKIAEEIRQHPTVIREKGETQVYQRGILGGVRRIL
jgi:hypothetical protein